MPNPENNPIPPSDLDDRGYNMRILIGKRHAITLYFSGGNPIPNSTAA